MNKINCGVCGNKYPESADKCPICGCIRADGAKTVEDEIIMEEAQVPARPSVRGGRFSKANVRKRNKNMARYEMRAENVRVEEPEEPEEEEVESGKGSNTVLNVLLVIVIIALLAVTGYIFVKYFLPNIMEVSDTTPTTEVVSTTEASEGPTEEPTVPCTGLELVNGSTEVVLTERGQAWLLNIQVLPEDTTDEMVYTSDDEAVVTVDGQGTILAVGEGETTVTAACGAQQIEFNVVCFFVNETEPEETLPEPTEPEVTEPEETEAPTEPLKTVVLEVNKTDMTFTMIGQEFQMKVKNGLTAQEVTWTSENEGIVTVDENGLITCVGWGTTNVIAKYGDQEVVIICRCKR